MEYENKVRYWLNLCERGPSAPRTWDRLSWQHMALQWCGFCSWHSARNRYAHCCRLTVLILHLKRSTGLDIQYKLLNLSSPLRHCAISPYPSCSPTHWLVSPLSHKLQNPSVKICAITSSVCVVYVKHSARTFTVVTGLGQGLTVGEHRDLWHSNSHHCSLLSRFVLW